MTEIREYLDESENSPFAVWFNNQEPVTAAKITTALTRLEIGNFSNVKGVGKGVFEYRIHFGPGIRIYFGKQGDSIVILLAGGTKKRQQKDIEKAIERWQIYKKKR